MNVEQHIAPKLIAVVGSTHTIHWATRNQNGRLLSLCANGIDLSVRFAVEVSCTNCIKVAEQPEALAQRAHATELAENYKFGRPERFTGERP